MDRVTALLAKSVNFMKEIKKKVLTNFLSRFLTNNQSKAEIECNQNECYNEGKRCIPLQQCLFLKSTASNHDVVQLLCSPLVFLRVVHQLLAGAGHIYRQNPLQVTRSNFSTRCTTSSMFFRMMFWISIRFSLIWLYPSKPLVDWS